MGSAARRERNSLALSPYHGVDAGAKAELAASIISVCVCTRGQSIDLDRCLASISDQRLTGSDHVLRIVVVDNSMDRSAFDSVQALHHLCAPVVYVHEPRPGIPIARNAALIAAIDLQSDWIAFIDDDEVAPGRWLDSLLVEAEHSQADVIHGAVRRSSERDDIDRLSAAWSPDGQPSHIERTNKAATNNVLFRAWLVASPACLRFDEKMSDSGGSDGEFFMRANDLGACIVRTTGAPVFEMWPEERESLTASSRRAFRVGANCNYRYRKNRSWLTAICLLLARSAERIGAGLIRLFIATCLSFVSRERAGSAFRKSVLDFCFASGCLLPFFGLTPKSYH